ncbi:MAG: hypothetical protein HOV87_30420 [Catenulispora sp.]|nr:hypothetical protein [Catenulispora sp.]
MDGPDRVSFLGRPCPRGFHVQLVILEPGDSVGYQFSDWPDALVVVERGELDVECRSGEHARFGEGAVLAFTALPVRRLHSVGAVALVLSALAREQATGWGAGRR